MDCRVKKTLFRLIFLNQQIFRIVNCDDSNRVTLTLTRNKSNIFLIVSLWESTLYTVILDNICSIYC